jgi:hypothetical protein
MQHQSSIVVETKNTKGVKHIHRTNKLILRTKHKKQKSAIRKQKLLLLLSHFLSSHLFLPTLHTSLHRGGFTHSNQPLNSNHPMRPLCFQLHPHHLRQHDTSTIKVSALYRIRNLHQHSNGIRFNERLIVEMIKQNVQSFFRVVDLSGKGGWGARFYACHVCG